MKGFVEIGGFNNYFIKNNPPKVVRFVDGKYLECVQTPNSVKDNYWTVTMRCSDTGKFLKRSVHRLLMLAFVENPLGKAHVNHIDGDKSNNDMSNLEWATPKENAQHAVRIGLVNNESQMKEIHQYTLSGRFLKSYRNAECAEMETGIERTNMRTCARGKRPQAGNFQWSYVKEDYIQPTKSKYVKLYKYDGKEFKTLKVLAEYLGIDSPSKAGISTFSKEVRQGIKTVYYE